MIHNSICSNEPPGNSLSGGFVVLGFANANIEDLKILKSNALNLNFDNKMLNSKAKKLSFTAIPYYAVGNREKQGYKVWVDALEVVGK